VQGRIEQGPDNKRERRHPEGPSPRFSGPWRPKTEKLYGELTKTPFSNFGKGLTPHERCEIEAQLSLWDEELTAGDWALIGQQADDEAERALCRDPADVGHVEYLESRLCGRRGRTRARRALRRTA
jgi:hypothetical protein